MQRDHMMGWPQALDYLDLPSDYPSYGCTPAKPQVSVAEEAKRYHMDTLETNKLAQGLVKRAAMKKVSSVSTASNTWTRKPPEQSGWYVANAVPDTALKSPPPENRGKFLRYYDGKSWHRAMPIRKCNRMVNASIDFYASAHSFYNKPDMIMWLRPAMPREVAGIE